MRINFVFLTAIVLFGCEAPLMLDGVESSKKSPILRTDIFLAATHSAEKYIIVGAEGIILTAVSGTSEWQRTQVEGKPTFIDVTRCDQGVIAALTMEGLVWTSTDQAQTWSPHQIGTPEIPQAITCNKKGVIWVVGSFSTIFSSSDAGVNWVSHSLEEDMILSTVQFLDENKGVITGEFGTVLLTQDGGETWDFGEPIPNEFFPITSVFKDDQNGWVAGLNGIIFSTVDGAASWQQEKTAINAPLYGMTIINDEIIAVGDYGSIIHKNINNNIKNDWQPLDMPTKSRFFFRVVHPINNSKIIIAGGAGTLDVVDLANVNLKNVEIN